MSYSERNVYCVKKTKRAINSKKKGRDAKVFAYYYVALTKFTMWRGHPNEKRIPLAKIAVHAQ